ncbi:hypothetical protein BJ875DRAFT_457391 [Amylocarpus encephaloides]|uniref:Uncharacterized protein n=1 Tax=Amylocarpus encephaloides TaxID=45428 RepID=A0A9P7YMS0_9HELO|nr:hypothetical protein BJ875DRAFT_457391 [Amylocarpus encephaloides]
MRSFSLQALAFFSASASLASAGSVEIKNYCEHSIYIRQSDPTKMGGCDMGPDTSKCYSDAYEVKPNELVPLDMTISGQGVAIKISKTPSLEKITQFEYCASDNMYWDVSDLDGQGSNRVGSPFYHDNIKAYPLGNRDGFSDCKDVNCKKDQVCEDAYQYPDQKATLTCPLDMQSFRFDFCTSDGDVSKRSVVFMA